MPAVVRRRGPASVVTLDWPATRNALGPAEAVELSTALAGAADDPEVKVVVLAGNGAFCAGGNLPVIAEIARRSEEELRQVVYGAFQGLVRALLGVPVPTVAAVDGPAVGLGLDLALACDRTLVGTDGWVRQGWAQVGLIPGTGGSFLLRRRSPTALWALLGDGRRLDGPAAAAHGIGVAVDGSAEDEALAWAGSLDPVPRTTLEGYVRLHRLATDDPAFTAHLDACLDIQVSLLRSSRFLALAERMGAGG